MPIIALSLVSLCSSAGDYQPAAGLGQQYGDVLGTQFAYTTEASKYFVSLGLVGFSADCSNNV